MTSAVTLWPDSNFARNAEDLFNLIAAATTRGIAVFVHAQVFLEVRRYRMVTPSKSGRPFDPTVFDSLFSPSGIRGMRAAYATLEVTFEQGRRWSESLASRYPTDNDWQAIKRQALRATTGAKVGESRHVPMTADWWIALSLEELEGAHVITDDKGPEWQHLRDQKRVITAAEVDGFLARYPAP